VKVNEYLPNFDVEVTSLVHIRPCLFYLLDYGIAALQKPKSEKKKKSSALSFFTCVFFPPLICVANKKLFSVDHIGRAYKSAIPRGRLKCSAVLLLEM
jgi:hypothetical protein